MLPALAVLAGLAVARGVYPRVIAWQQRRRRPLGPDGIIVGAAPRDHPREQAPAALLLHGAGDTPQIMSDLALHLHQQGFAVRAPLLSSHGRSLDALAGASAMAWRNEVAHEYDTLKQRHESVAIVGLSMGGALAISLAAERRDVSALVLLAPYIAMPPRIRALAETSNYWGWAVPFFSSRGGASIKDRDAAGKTLGRGIMTPALLRALRDVVDAADAALPAVQSPTLVIQSREDNRIAPEVAERGFARLGSSEKRFLWTNGASHVITVDFGYQRVFDLTTQWLEDHRTTHASGVKPSA